MEVAHGGGGLVALDGGRRAGAVAERGGGGSGGVRRRGGRDRGCDAGGWWLVVGAPAVLRLRDRPIHREISLFDLTGGSGEKLSTSL